MTDAYTSYFKLDYDNTESYKDLEKFFIDNGFKKLPTSDIVRPMYFQKGNLKIIIIWYRNLATLRMKNEKDGDFIEFYFNEICGALIPYMGCETYEFLYKGNRLAKLAVKKQENEA